MTDDIHLVNLKDLPSGFAVLRKLIQSEPKRAMLGSIGRALMRDFTQKNFDKINSSGKFDLMVMDSIFRTLEFAANGDDEIMSGVFEAYMEDHEREYLKLVPESKKAETENSVG